MAGVFFGPTLRRAFASLLVLLALGASAAAGPSPPPTALLVPLDDRPSTRLFPEQVARIGGGELRIPPRFLLGRARHPGDPARLGAWMRSAAPGVERAVVSTDMIAYGGLVASRAAQTSLEEALGRLEALDELHRAGVPVVAFAILPRLALRTSDEEAPFETALARWAASGSPDPPAGVPAPLVEEYRAVRRRNLEVLKALVERVADGTLETLVLGQDDSAPRGPHVEEQRLLQDRVRERGLQDRVCLVSGADELAMNLVAGWLARRAGVRPLFEVRYSEPDAGSRIPPLESRSLDETMDAHLALSGAARGAGRGPILLVEVPAAKPFEPPALEPGPEDLERAAALGRRLEEARATGRPVAVADLRLVNRADPVLARELLDRIPLWDLEAYAAWNTPSNALGTALAQAVVHQVARARGRAWPGGRVLESEKTQQAFTLARLVDDYAYQALIRPTLGEAVRGLPDNPDPLLNLYGPAGVQARLEAVAWARGVWKRLLEGRRYPVPALGREVRLQAMNLEVLLPWPRIFEVEVRLDLRLVPLPAGPPSAGRSGEGVLPSGREPGAP